MRRRQFVTLLAGAVAGWPLRAHAQDYPARTVTIIVPFTPAGTTDILGRLAAKALEQGLGKPFVVENRPGAGQQIGASAVAKAPADGHTLLVATSSAMAINPTLYKKITYDPVRDFAPVAMLAHVPFILLVNPSLPVRNVADLIRYARERPRQLSFGSGGVGASHHLYGELFNTLAGVQMTHVPYKGTVPALNDLIGGHIQVLFSDPPPALALIKSGQIRALGVTTGKRILAAPELPPIGETVAGYDSAPWQMLCAPAATPRAVVDTLHGELVRYIATPEAQAKLTEMGLVPAEPTPPAELARFIEREIATWGKIVHQAGAAGIE